MELVDQVVLQLLQPSFYYATVVMAIALAISTLLIRINTFGPRGRSVLLIAPMAAALIALVIFPPTLFVPALPDAHMVPGGLLPPGASYLPIAAKSVVSLTGLLVVTGLILGALSLLFSLVFAGHLTRRLLQVVDLGREDFPELAEDVEDIAAKLGIPKPSLGLVEDLRPNAFTFGTGRGATVVFSLGMLDVLDRKELRAVAAHELAHIKNQDVRFKASARAMTWSFFFNPAAHLSARAAHRERERLADETAGSVLGDRASLIRAIEKVTRTCQLETARPTLASRIGLGISLSLVERNALLSDHPSLADRTRQFTHEHAGRAFTPMVCLALSLGVIIAGAVLAMSMGEIRADIIHSVLSDAGSIQGMGPQVVGSEMAWTGPGPMHPHHLEAPPEDPMSMSFGHQ
jgi:Zn-dependent protease with chaperone function